MAFCHKCYPLDGSDLSLLCVYVYVIGNVKRTKKQREHSDSSIKIALYTQTPSLHPCWKSWYLQFGHLHFAPLQSGYLHFDHLEHRTLGPRLRAVEVHSCKGSTSYPIRFHITHFAFKGSMRQPEAQTIEPQQNGARSDSGQDKCNF